MHYGIVTPDGKILHVECDLREIEEKCERMNGGIVTEAETFELYEKRRSQDQTGHFCAT